MLEKVKVWLFLLTALTALILFSVSCTRMAPNNGIPIVAVDFNVYLDNPDNQVLNAIGNWRYFENVGSRGIIVYRKAFDEFVVYDRHCTFQPENPCGRVSVMSDNVTVQDTCCGSRFLLFDGSIVNGPAKWPLKAYQVFYNNNVLRITN